MGTIIRYILSFFLCFFILSCSVEQREKEPISSSEALKLAKKKIIKYETLLKINADLLPPLQMTKEEERYKFEVEDEEQDIRITVSVSFFGEVNLSKLSLTEKRGRVERAREKTKNNR